MSGNFREFLMEDHLESFRFKKYNLGESGASARSTYELLSGSGLSSNEINTQFSSIVLRDSPNWGRDDLRECVAKIHPGASIENVLITTGTSEALFLLFRYLKPKKIALPIPGFQLLYEIPQSMGAEVIPLPIRWDHEGKPYYDKEEWIAILKESKPDTVLINNPHNPSGVVFDFDFMEEVKKICKNNNSCFIGDEHYRFLSDDTKTVGSTLYEPGVFVTGSFIKCLGCPGLRIGWVVGDNEVLKHLQSEKNYTTHTVNPLSEWISYEVLKNFESPLFLKSHHEWVENRKLLHNFLSQTNKFYGVSPIGGLVTSIGVREISNEAEFTGFYKRLLEKDIFLLPLTSMDFGAFEFQKDPSLSLINKGYGFRLGLGLPPVIFNEFLLELEKF